MCIKYFEPFELVAFFHSYINSCYLFFVVSFIFCCCCCCCYCSFFFHFLLFLARSVAAYLCCEYISVFFVPLWLNVHLDLLLLCGSALLSQIRCMKYKSSLHDNIVCVFEHSINVFGEWENELTGHWDTHMLQTNRTGQQSK